MEAKLVVFVVIIISLIPIVYLWVKGIDYMHKTHPNYKGEDLFDESEIDTTKIAGRDSWDDNTHIE
jgi:hypothetical protein